MVVARAVETAVKLAPRQDVRLPPFYARVQACHKKVVVHATRQAQTGAQMPLKVAVVMVVMGL